MRRVYQVKDISGDVIAEHVRVVMPDGTKRMYWQTPGCDPRDGLMGIGTADLPLYGSERIPTYTIGQTIVVTEGEKATEALWSLGIAAVGTVTGASGVPGEDALSPLLPFDVVLWPDHDEAGDKHMTRVAASLIRLGGGARRLTWGHDKGDDAADFVAGGGTRVTAELLMQAATVWRVEPSVPIRLLRPSYRDDDTRVTAAKSHLVDVVCQKLGAPKRHDSRSMWWCCPFHSERSASFKVDLREPFYRCFGCDARGDVFTFLREIEGLEFKDALGTLAPPRALGGIQGFSA